MHRAAWLCLLVLPLAVACPGGTRRDAHEPAPTSAQADAPAPVRWIGQVRGHAGQPLAAGRLAVRRVGYMDPIAVLELPADGRVELELPSPGAYMLDASGVDHAQSYQHLLVTDAQIEVDLQLGTYAREDTGDALAVRLRWLGDDGEPLGAPIDASATRAEPGGDHRLRVEAPAAARALQYQLTGVGFGRTFNGPGGQRWVYDGDGDYWAEIDASPGAALELVLDLDVLPPADQPAQTRLAGAELYPLPAAQAPLRAVWDQFNADELVALVNVAKIAGEARTAVEAVEDPLVAKLAAIEWLLFFAQFAREEQIPAADLTWVFERVPFDDPAWIFYATRLAVLRWADKPELDAALSALAEQQTDPGLLAAVRAEALYIAQRRGEAEAVAAGYAALVRDYPGTIALERARVDFDPARPLQVGRPMPDWSFVGLDGETPIRAADLRGKPYLFELWASWCGPCVADMDSIHAAYAAINPDPERPAIEFVAVSVDASIADVVRFRGQWPMPWRNAWLDGEGWKALEQRWRINAVPTVVLVDADGIIVDLGGAVRGEQLLPRLQRLLAGG